LGIPFYGYQFKGNERPEPILGNKYLEILKKEKPSILWDESSHEHYFKFGLDDKVIYYPTLNFIWERLQLAEELGVGCAIWEIGQGLDYFFDLL